MSPWMDLIVPPKEVKLPAVEAQTHRPFLKTRLPVDALVSSKKAKYQYIGRDGRDVLWSMFNNHSRANDAWYAALNDTPGRIGPPIKKPIVLITQYYHGWLDFDGHHWWSFWQNIRYWWAIRDLPNVYFVHFANLQTNMAGEIRLIAEFLQTPGDNKRWERIFRHCSFDYMKAHTTKSVPRWSILGGWRANANSQKAPMAVGVRFFKPMRSINMNSELQTSWAMSVRTGLKQEKCL